MAKKTLKERMTDAMTIVETFTGYDRKGRDYRVEVYEDGEFAGDRHIRDGKVIAHNRWRQSADDAVALIRDRWWPLAVAFGDVKPTAK